MSAMSKPILQVIIASTRPGRLGIHVGNWFAEVAKAYGAFDVQIADLKEIALPPLNEPNHPATGDYVEPETKAWAKTIGDSSAIAIVTPEYNHSYPGTLKNAIDRLGPEWIGKPVGFVSYGGVAGGSRAVEHLVPILNFMGMNVLTAQVMLPFAWAHLGEVGAYAPPEEVAASAADLLAAFAANVA
jgi:NAD(P)H-dependent FMN reductase